MDKLDRVIGETVDGLGLRRDLRRALAVAEWPRAVGEEIAGRTAAYMITRSGTLFVWAASPAWAQELTAMKPRLIESLNAGLGGDIVKDIRFQGKGLGGTRPPVAGPAHSGRSAPPGETDGEDKDGMTGPSGAELDAHPLDPADAERIAAALSGAKPSRARDTLERVLSRDAKLRRWRMSHGWQECPGCGGLMPPRGAAQCLDCAASNTKRTP